MAWRPVKWEEAFRRYVEKLCKHPLVLEAYLVGSRARGDNLSYSDYDVAVIIPEDVDKLDAAVVLRRLRDEPFPLDIIPLYPEDKNDPLYRKMLEEAKKLCQRSSTSSSGEQQSWENRLQRKSNTAIPGNDVW